MLWLAEKCAELGATTWRPVLWRRSRSVQPRGEGIAFQAKVRARMIGALEQSGNPWLPVIYPDAPLDRAVAATPEGTRVVLDQGGIPFLASRPLAAPIILAVGPEGGFDDAERVILGGAGFIGVSVSSNVLRFETAATTGLGLARALLATEGGSSQ
jgi:16S rRNA (uracil1498-N3)-methyltransferase